MNKPAALVNVPSLRIHRLLHFAELKAQRRAESTAVWWDDAAKALITPANHRRGPGEIARAANEGPPIGSFKPLDGKRQNEQRARNAWIQKGD